MGQLLLTFPLGSVSPRSAAFCLLLVPSQLPDYLLLLAFTGLDSPPAPFELALQFGPKRLLPCHHYLRFHNSKSGLHRQDPILHAGFQGSTQ